MGRAGRPINWHTQRPIPAFRPSVTPWRPHPAPRSIPPVKWGAEVSLFPSRTQISQVTLFSRTLDHIRPKQNGVLETSRHQGILHDIIGDTRARARRFVKGGRLKLQYVSMWVPLNQIICCRCGLLANETYIIRNQQDTISHIIVSKCRKCLFFSKLSHRNNPEY